MMKRRKRTYVLKPQIFTKNNGVFWDITPCGFCKNKNFSVNVRVEVLTAVTMKNGVLWDVTPCDFCKNRCFGGTQRLHYQDGLNR
jgi:hypothetical protein